MIIIPARAASTRFPNKALVDILGLPMVVRCAKIAKQIDKTIVATDCEDIVKTCAKYGIEAVMTSANHTSGTDRIAEAARIVGVKENELVINMQGDEPFLEPSVILALKNLMNSCLKVNGKFSFMGTCAKIISPKEAEDPNLVKVVCGDFICNKSEISFCNSERSDISCHSEQSDVSCHSERSEAERRISKDSIESNHKKATNLKSQIESKLDSIESTMQKALYFSRSKIPYPRDGQNARYLGHLGIYAFSGESLQEFCNLQKSPLEECEKLEQLRALSAGHDILVALVESESFGIDTPQDLKNALEIFKK